MTIQVTIKHDQPDYPRNIRVCVVDDGGRLVAPMTVLKPGQECSRYVYKGNHIEITEDEA